MRTTGRSLEPFIITSYKSEVTMQIEPHHQTPAQLFEADEDSVVNAVNLGDYGQKCRSFDASEEVADE